jgi:hypothetical protein
MLQSPESATGHWRPAYGALLRSEPGEARNLAARALRRRGRARTTFALRVVHGAALFDEGSRHRGLQEMQQARTDLGAFSPVGEQAAVPALLEHRAALALDRPDAAGAVVRWLEERNGAIGELLLMRAWAALSVGHDQAARSAVGPVLNGSVPALLPHTVVEALLVETTALVTGGEVHRARRVLLTALSLSAPLDVVRPFATAEPPARASSVIIYAAAGRQSRSPRGRRPPAMVSTGDGPGSSRRPSCRWSGSWRRRCRSNRSPPSSTSGAPRKRTACSARSTGSSERAAGAVRSPQHANAG